MKPIEINDSMNWKLSTFTIIALAALISGCSGERSGATGWAYNSTTNGGFESNLFTTKKQLQGSFSWKVEPSPWAKLKTI
jgi:hypothetical protein